MEQPWEEEWTRGVGIRASKTCPCSLRLGRPYSPIIMALYRKNAVICPSLRVEIPLFSSGVRVVGRGMNKTQ